MTYREQQNLALKARDSKVLPFKTKAVGWISLAARLLAAAELSARRRAANPEALARTEAAAEALAADIAECQAFAADNHDVAIELGQVEAGYGEARQRLDRARHLLAAAG